MIETVAIVGVGLIGGSFARSLRQAGFGGALLGVDKVEVLAEAVRLGVIDEGLTLSEAIPRADLVYLAPRTLQILELLDQLDPLLKQGALITDAGSTKQALAERAAQRITRGQYLGGHPMAGKAQRGVAHSEAGLFRNRTYILTPRSPADLETPVAREFIEWLKRMGAQPLILAPEQHDRIVAATSHLPQVMATALAALLADTLAPEQHRISGPGLLDMTRLAGSSWAVWADILATNAGNVDEMLAAYIARLESIRSRLHSGSLEQEFAAAADFAAQLRS